MKTTKKIPKRSKTEDASGESASVKTLQKALKILDEFAESGQPLTIAEVSSRVGITRPTAYRLVQTLIGSGYLSQNADDKKVTPGYSVLQLAASLLDTNRLRIESLPHLESLARQTGERSNLGILHHNKLLYIAGVEKPTLPTLYSRFGRTASAYSAALGKAILANLPAEDLEVYFSQVELIPFTPKTITEKQLLLDELNKTRQQGYAIDDEEQSQGAAMHATP